jgi:hypothetical protein
MESESSGGLAQAKARLQLGAAAVAPGAELGYWIANDGQMPLLYGAGYGFERRAANGWESVPIALAFPAWGARIVPDEDSGAMVARVPSNQASGHYRLVTSVIVLHADSTPMRGPDGPITIKLSCEFSITR